jgi:hypothetical protein
MGPGVWAVVETVLQGVPVRSKPVNLVWPTPVVAVVQPEVQMPALPEATAGRASWSSAIRCRRQRQSHPEASAGCRRIAHCRTAKG